ncbi:MAG: mycothiol synthase [Chloroflexota bacterium]|jgi:mycothiol synthase|nr:mycothiol synthase [Chloroflexota bacterium]
MTQSTQAGRVLLPDTPPIAGLQARFLEEDADYEPLSALMRTCHRHDGIPWLPSATTVRFEMALDGIEPARDVVLVGADDRLVAATGVDRGIRDGVPSYQVWGHVTPELRRRGIGSWLLDWTLRRTRERAETEDPEGTVRIQAHVDGEDTGAQAIYRRAGFEPVRRFFLMLRDGLDEVPAAPLPDGLEIRPVTPDQHRAIFDAEDEAFRDHWGHRDMGDDAFRQTFGQAETNTNLWVVAWDGDQVAGVVENWIWPDENRQLGIRRGWLERVSVRRPWRRRGLGRALTAASLVRLREAGMDQGMLGVDADNPSGALVLYDSLGFVVDRRSFAYRRQLDR